MGPSGRVEQEIGQRFGLSPGLQQEGWLGVESVGGTGISGCLTYETATALAPVVALPEPRSPLTFSHVEETDSLFTGLALVNPHREAAAVQIELHRTDGKEAGDWVRRTMKSKMISGFSIITMAMALSAWAGLGQQSPRPAKPEQGVTCTATAPASGQTGALLQFQGSSSASTAPGSLYDVDPIVGNLRYVPAGSFTQGSPTSEACRNFTENQFTHTLTKSLAVMETAVTRQMWAALRSSQGSLPADPSASSYSSGTSDPVQNVTWYEAVLFANLLSSQRGLTPVYRIVSAGGAVGAVLDASNYLDSIVVYMDGSAGGYRLPTEGEREYFTRAGTTGPFSITEPAYNSGNCRSCSAGVLPALESVAWFCANSGGTTHPAGSKGANAWGLKDVHGNVWEWCWDWYIGNYPGGTQTDYSGPHSATGGPYRVIRGDGWGAFPWGVRSANRAPNPPGGRSDNFGFRLLRSVNTAQTSWDWDFGDGTAHSALQNPQHAYTRAGTYTWTMRVTIDGVTCSKSGTIVITDPVTGGQLRGALDSPDGKNPVAGVVNVVGWAVLVSGNQAGKATRVELLVDGVFYAMLTTGMNRPDVRDNLAGTGVTAPSDLGFSGTWDSRSVFDGNHTLTIRAADAAGSVREAISDIATVTVRTANGIAPSTTTASTTSTSSTTTTRPSTSTTTTTPTSSTTTTSTSSTTTTTGMPSGQVYLTFDNCGGARGGTIKLELKLGAQGLSDIQFNLVFNPAVLTFTQADAGPQAQLGGKTITRKSLVTSGGEWEITIGSTQNKRIIEGGTVAVLHFQVAATAPLAPTSILLNKAFGLAPQGQRYPMPEFQRDMEVLGIPVLDHISPTSGAAGTLLVLRGANFGSCLSSTRVVFTGTGDYKPTVIPDEVSPNRVVVTVPADAVGRLTVTLNIADVPSRSTALFTIDANQPFSSLSTELEEMAPLGDRALPAGAAIDSRSNLAYVAVADNLGNRIAVIDVATGKKLGEYAVPGGSPARVAVNPVSRRVTATQPLINSLCILQIQADGALLNPRLLTVGTNPLGVAINPLTNLAVVANNGSQNVSLVDLDGPRIVATLPTGKQPLDVTIDSARNRAFVINSGDNSVTEIDLAAARVARTISGVGSTPLSVDFHAETGTLLVGSNSGLLLSNVDQKYNVPLLAGESVDGMTVHARRGAVNIVNNASGRLTTVDLQSAFADERRAIVGSNTLKNAAVRGMALNSSSNQGLVTHASGAASGAAEQAGTAGFSRLTMPTSLNFPRLLLNAAGDVFGLAISNPTADAGTLQMTAIGSTGQQVQAAGVRNPSTQTLPAQGQISRLETEPGLFGDGIRSQGDIWYKLIAPNPGLKAFFLTADREFKNSIVGAEEAGLLLSEGILPAVRSDARVLVSFINPLPVAASVTLKLVSNSGATLESVSRGIPAFGLLQKNLEELFSAGFLQQVGAGAYLRVSSVPGIRGYQLLVPAGRLDPAGFNAQSAVSGPSTLYFSYFVAGQGAGINYETRAGIVNLEAAEQTAVLSIRGADGALLAAAQSVRIPGYGRVEPDLRALFQLPAGALTQGWLRIEGTGRLAGYLTYAAAQALAAVVNLAEPMTQLTFSHVAEEGTGFFTGLALLNTNAEAATVNISVYRADGQTSGSSGPMILPPNGQKVALLNELVGAGVKGQAGGYVVVKSTLPIHGIEIFGTADGRAMANVPAQ